MDREIVLLVLALALCGPLAMIASNAVMRPSRSAPEERNWRAVWSPLLPAGFAFALLLGWAIQEPNPPDEILRPWVCVMAAVIAVVWARASFRALSSAFARHDDLPASTSGWIRPRIHLTRSFLSQIDAAARRAAHEHEAAHARHRDPFRIWLAQFATDLQWPSPSASLRFQAWMNSLEIARDDEARRRGVDGADLAAAILAAVRLTRGRPSSSACALPGIGGSLKERIDRLLCPLPDHTSSSAGTWMSGVLAVALVAAAVLGVFHGESFVRLIPGLIG